MLGENKYLGVRGCSLMLVNNWNIYVFSVSFRGAQAQEFRIGVLGFKNRISPPIYRLALRRIAGFEPERGKFWGEESLRNLRIADIIRLEKGLGFLLAELEAALGRFCKGTQGK